MKWLWLCLVILLRRFCAVVRKDDCSHTVGQVRDTEKDIGYLRSPTRQRQPAARLENTWLIWMQVIRANSGVPAAFASDGPFVRYYRV